MYTRRIINKVPGNLLVESKKEKQGYIGDLSQKSVSQLNELLDRQLKLLANRAFINRLGDNGEKITTLKNSIEDELKKRSDSENLSHMLSAMSMNDKEDLDALEWTGRCAPEHIAADENTNISDDELDPYRILASHSGAGFHKKKHKTIKPEEPLIKLSDLEDNENAKHCSKDEVLDEYAKHLCRKMDTVTTSDRKNKFLPFKTLKDCKEKRKEPMKKTTTWEVTAATPPPLIHSDIKMVSLQESLQLQYEQQQKLKEIQVKHAAERLLTLGDQNISIGRLPPTVGDYRDPTSGTSSEGEGSDHEVHDEEERDGGGVVIYNLVDDIESKTNYENV